MVYDLPSAVSRKTVGRRPGHGSITKVGIIGAFVDNIPYTTAMVPIVENMVAATGSAGPDSPLWWAFVFGADLGGNATAVAAGANVVVLGIAAKAGEPISFWSSRSTASW